MFFFRWWDCKKSFVITKQKLESWKLIKQTKNESDPSLLLKLENLKDQVKFHENEKLLLIEQLDNFKSNKIEFIFKKGQYSNSTHAAYQNLVSYAGVSANKVDKVVDTVLAQFARIQVVWLPKSTLAKDLTIKSRGWHSTRMPQLSGSCTNITLHSEDGATKHCHFYTIFDVINEQGKLLVCGWIHLLGPSGPNVVSRSQIPMSRNFLDFMILLNSFHDFWENEVLFVKIGARVLDLWLDLSSGPKWPKYSF